MFFFLHGSQVLLGEQRDEMGFFLVKVQGREELLVLRVRRSDRGLVAGTVVACCWSRG